MFPLEQLKPNSNNNMTLENNQADNNSPVNKPIFTILVASTNGHDTVAEVVVEDAVEEIIKQVQTHARWVFINGESFLFSGSKIDSLENKTKLHTALSNHLEGGQVMLTGELTGGLALR